MVLSKCPCARLRVPAHIHPHRVLGGKTLSPRFAGNKGIREQRLLLRATLWKEAEPGHSTGSAEPVSAEEGGAMGAQDLKADPLRLPLGCALGPSLPSPS